MEQQITIEEINKNINITKIMGVCIAISVIILIIMFSIKQDILFGILLIFMAVLFTQMSTINDIYKIRRDIKNLQK